MKDEWLAAALRAVEDAMEAADRCITDLNKAKIFKKVLQSVAHSALLEGVSNLSTFEMAKLVKPLADLLVSQQPTSKPNSEDSDFLRVKERIKDDKTGAGNDAPTH